MRGILHLLVPGLAATLLAACGAITINELDRELIDTYLVKVRMAEAEGPFSHSEAVNERFSAISRRAMQAAENLGQEKTLDKIALLRIAATASWQANDRPVPIVEGDPAQTARETDERKLVSVFTIATKGRELCASEDLAGKQPRDCAYFEIVNVLNKQTVNGRELERYRARKDLVSTEDRLRLARDYLLAAVAAFAEATEHRASLSRRAVPESYYRWLDRQRLFAFCDARLAANEYNEVYADMPSATPLAGDCTGRISEHTTPAIQAMRQSLAPSFDAPRCDTLDATSAGWRFAPTAGANPVPSPTLPDGNICAP